MAVGDTDVGICNKALTYLGADLFTSFTDGSPAASACDTIYKEVKTISFGLYPWSFTIAKTELVRDAHTPENEWTYQYILPPDMVNLVPRAVRASKLPGGAIQTGNWEMNQARQGYQVLMTNLTEVHIDYQKVVSEGSMPTYFVQFLAYQLAWHLAEIMTDQVGKAQYWRTVALGTEADSGRGGYFRQAVNIDAGGQTPQVIGQYMLTDIRA